MPRYYELATKFSTEHMLATAYKDWTASITSKYAELMSMVAYVVNNADHEVNKSEIINNAMTMYPASNYTLNSYVITNETVMKLVDYLGAIYDGISDTTAQIDSPTTPADEDPLVVLRKINGDSFTKTIGTIMDELNATFHAISVDNAIATAYETGADIVSRISIFRDTMHEKFVDAYTDVSNTLENAAAKLKSGMGVTDYFINRIQTSGIKDAAERNLAFEECADLLYTGATPASAYAFAEGCNTVIDDIGQAFEVVGTIIENIADGWALFMSSVTEKAKTEVYQSTVNPYDIESINVKGNHTVNGLWYENTVSLRQLPTLRSKIIEGPIHTDLIPFESVIQYKGRNNELPTTIKECLRVLWRYVNFDYSPGDPYPSTIEDLVEEILFYLGGGLPTTVYNDLASVNIAMFNKLHDVEIQGMGSYETNLPSTILELCQLYLTYHPDYDELAIEAVKIKPIKSEFLIPYISSAGTIIGSNVIDQLEYLAKSGNIYVDTDSSEESMYKGFLTGCYLYKTLSYILYDEANGMTEQQIRNKTYGINSDQFKNTLVNKSDITNLDFFKILTAFEFQPMNSNDWALIQIESGDQILYPLMLDNILNYQETYPFDNAFWPYSRNIIRWYESSFRLKTDAENQQAFSNFIAKAMIITIIAVISIVSVIKLKKAARTAYLEQQGAIWNASDKASKGLMTDADVNRYKKATFKSNVLNKLAGNTMAAATASTTAATTHLFSNTTQTSVDLTPVIDLITG